MEQRLIRALQFAEAMHEGQVDKAGAPYIEHPKTVASMVDGEDAKIVAILHDVVEDTPATVEEIREMFGDVVADAVESITHGKDEPYMDYIERVKRNELAKKVKLADIAHNMDISRIANPTEADFRRVEKKYRPALKLLIG